MAVNNSNRFKRTNPCPICRGYETQQRGKGLRCHGFISEDGNWAHCTREDFSGGLQQYPKSETYAHLLYGDCNCGTEHNPKTASPKHSSKQFKTGIVAEYDYVDEFGELLYQVCRKEPKGFYQRRPHDDGSWIWALSEGEYAKQPNGDWKLVKAETPSTYLKDNFEEVRRVLYRLPELLNADLQKTVFIVEGEKDADALNKLGLVATTNVTGSGKWRKEYNEYLKDRPVVILPDNDDVGQSHAIQVADYIKGIAKSIKIIKLPNLPEKGDVSDWLDAGGTVKELTELVKSDSFQKQEARSTSQSNIISAASLMAKEFPEPKFAIPGLLSEGVTLFAGKPKLGKSWCGLGMALAVASGGQALGTISVEQGNVLYLALEDGERRLKDRLQKITGNGSVPEELEFATTWSRLNEGGLEQLEKWLVEHPNARIIFIDTLKRVRPQERGNKQLYDSDYDAISPLGDLARKFGVSIVLIHHTRKMDSEDPIDMISGSLGLSGSADGALVLTRSRTSVQGKLHVMGRDFEDRELALDWDSGTYGWTLAGDAEQFSVGSERREIINLSLMDSPTRFTPKKVAVELNRNEVATRKLMSAMHKDGQLDNDGFGNYTVIINNGNYTNLSNLSNSGNYSNSSSGDNKNQSELPFSNEGNSVNRSNISYLADRVTRVTPVTIDFESEEWKERVAILEYENNMSREEAEFSARVSLDAQINLSKPENLLSDNDCKRAA